MPAQLVVHLNRRERNDVQPAAERFEVTGPFELRVHNHGRAAHVHVKVVGPLADVAAVDGHNQFVETDGTVLVPVRVADGAAGVEGAVEVVGGYGDTTERVPVVVREPDPDPATADEPDDDEPAGPAPDGSGASLAARLRAATPDLAFGRRARLAVVAVVGLALVGATTVLVDGEPLLVVLAAVLLGGALAVARRS